MKMKKIVTDDDEFSDWLEDHEADCGKNFDGSAGSMEPAALITIFKRSAQLHQSQYTGFLGDGDSKSHHRFTSMNPPVYEGKIVKKN